MNANVLRLALCLSVGILCGSSTQVTASKSAIVRNFDFPHVPGELIIKFKPGISKKSHASTLASFGGKITRRFKSSGALLSEFPKSFAGPELRSLALQLGQRSDVEYVEANTILKAINMPDDPKFGELYGLHNEAQTSGKDDADIDAPEAWNISTGSKNVLVAIIDTGVNYEHNDIKPNYWSNPGETGIDANGNDRSSNGIDDDGNGYVDDWRGWDFVNNDNDPMDDNSYTHGTHCAGTIGASGDDGFGVVGVNWQVSLVGVKFLSAAGSGSLSNAVLSIEYATTIGADIQSNSWGGGGFSQVMHDAIHAAHMQDQLFVAAAGNSSVDTDGNPHFPSSYDAPNLISVAATDHNDVMASFSNFGARTVDIAAPGVDIVSTADGQNFKTLSGTSMATPHVSGAAALIKAVHPGIDVEGLKLRLFNSVDPIAGLRGKVKYGGRLNVFNAIEVDNTAPGAVTSLAITAKGRNVVSLSWDSVGDDGMQGEASSYEIRLAATPIATEADWEAATAANSLFTGNKQMPAADIEGLPFNFVGYAAVRARDNVGNIGEVGNTVLIEVTPVQAVYSENADTLDHVDAESPWSLEMLDGRTSNGFSDSPGVLYENDVDASLTTELIAVNTQRSAFVYHTQLDLEKGYDFGYVEMSTDGGTSWEQVDVLTGSHSWHMRVIDLEPLLKGKTSFMMRFHLVTDYVIQQDGWWIDDIMVIQDL